MQNNPFFTIVIPTYNRSDLLPRCIDSVLNQTFKNWEVVIVDNYSEDGTYELLQEFVKRDSRIRFVQEHNHGIIAHSRNVGINAAKGDYIFFLDSDDWFSSNKLSIVYDALMDTKSDLIYHKMQIKSKGYEGKIVGKPLKWENKFEELLVRGNLIINSSVCVKKNAIQSIGGLSEDKMLQTAEDADCWLRIAKQGYKFLFINKVLGYYWIGNNSSSNIETLKQREYLYSIHMNSLSPSNKKRALHTLNYIRGIRYYEAGLKKQAISSYLKSIPMYSVGKTLKSFIMVFMSLFLK